MQIDIIYLKHSFGKNVYIVYSKTRVTLYYSHFTLYRLINIFLPAYSKDRNFTRNFYPVFFTLLIFL